MWQEQSQVHLKAPAVMKVHSRCYDIWLIGESNFGVCCTGLWETLAAALTFSRRISDQLMWPLRGSVGDFTLGAVFSQQWFWKSHNQKPWCQPCSSSLQSQDSPHYNMASISYQRLSIYIHMIELAANGTWAQLGEYLERMLEWT